MKFSELNNIKNNKSNILSLSECFAKTTINKSNESSLKTTVLQHCTIVGFVASELIKTLNKEYWKNRLPKNIAFIAAIHDIGKYLHLFKTNFVKLVIILNQIII